MSIAKCNACLCVYLEEFNACPSLCLEESQCLSVSRDRGMESVSLFSLLAEKFKVNLLIQCIA